MKRLLLLLSVLLLLPGCASTSGKKEASPEQVTYKESEKYDLTDEFYEKRWPGCKKVLWIMDQYDRLPDHAVVALNDILYKDDEPFVIQFRYMDCYAQDYQDKLLALKKKKEMVYLFNIGGTYVGETRNPYEDAIKKKLLMPLDSYLESSGDLLYAAMEPEQWEALRVNGHIYSCDPRSMPIRDLCVFVNKKYMDQTCDINSLESLFQRAAELAKENKEDNFYPVIWGDEEGAQEQWELPELTSQMKKNKELYTCFAQVNWEKKVDFFLYIRQENFMETSDEELLLDDVDATRVKIQKRTLKKDSYQPMVNGLTGVPSWLEKKADIYNAESLLYLIQCDPAIANLLQYGVQGENWEFDSRHKVAVNMDDRALGVFSPGNKWITYGTGLEPEQVVTKQKKYRSYLRAHFDEQEDSQ